MKIDTNSLHRVGEYMAELGYKARNGMREVKFVKALIKKGSLNESDVILNHPQPNRVAVYFTTEGWEKVHKEKPNILDVAPWDFAPHPEDKPVEVPEKEEVPKENIYPWDNDNRDDNADVNAKFYSDALATINDLKEQLAKAEKEVLFAKCVKSSEDCINVAMMAKILFQNGIQMTERRFFQWLRDNGFIEDNEQFKNIPTEAALNSGYMKFNECAIATNVGRVHISFTPKITGEGQEYFINHFIGDKHE